MQGSVPGEMLIAISVRGVSKVFLVLEIHDTYLAFGSP